MGFLEGTPATDTIEEARYFITVVAKGESHVFRIGIPAVFYTANEFERLTPRGDWVLIRHIKAHSMTQPGIDIQFRQIVERNFRYGPVVVFADFLDSIERIDDKMNFVSSQALVAVGIPNDGDFLHVAGFKTGNGYRSLVVERRQASFLGWIAVIRINGDVGCRAFTDVVYHCFQIDGPPQNGPFRFYGNVALRQRQIRFAEDLGTNRRRNLLFAVLGCNGIVVIPCFGKNDGKINPFLILRLSQFESFCRCRGSRSGKRCSNFKRRFTYSHLERNSQGDTQVLDQVLFSKCRFPGQDHQGILSRRP